MRLTNIGLSLTVMALFMVGCDHASNSKGSSNPPDSPLVQKLRGANLNCLVPGGCPESVGLVGVSFDSGYGQCTGFLVTDHIVATNSHCIPKSAKQNKSDCSSSIAIRFLAGHHPQDIYSCVRVLDFSGVSVLGADYAFFEIEPTGRVPLTIARDGVHDGEVLQSVMVTPINHGSMGGNIESSTCNVVLNSLLNIKAISPWSASGLVVGCRVVHGNSGSPLRNERGEVVGIIQSFSDDATRSVLSSVFAQVHLQMPDQLPLNAQFTNLSCVPDPVTNTYRRHECEQVAQFDASECRESKLESSGPEFDMLNKWSASLPHIFKYKYLADPMKTLVSAEPVCVLPTAQDNSTFVHHEGLLVRHQQLTADYDGDLTYKLKVLTNANFVIQHNGEVSEAGRTVHSIALSQSGTRWVGTDTTKTHMFSIMDRASNFDLAECTPAEVAAPEVTILKLPSGELIPEADYIARRNSKVRSPLCD